MKVTADDIAQLLSSAPPRLVPAHVIKAAQSRNTSAAGVVVGLFFVLLGLTFTAVMFPRHLGDEWRLASQAAATTQGVVTAVARTNVKVNKRPVMDTTFAFTPDGGKRQTADCYTTGSRWSVGETVVVRYLPDNPAVANLAGGRLDEIGWGGVFILVIPLSGAGMIFLFLRQRAETGRLLLAGQSAEVDVLSVAATRMRVNKQTVYKITLSAPAGGPPVTIRRTNPAEIETMQRYAAQKQPVFVLYDPRKPARMIFPEGLIEP